MVVESGLPLILVKGKFASLESMTVQELETFVAFMTKCSIQRASAATIDDVPVWWRSSITYQFPLQKPKDLSEKGYRRHLTSIVCRCYYYHDQQYIIQFSTQVARNPDSVVMKDVGDNKTSLFYSKTLVQIGTFSNENIKYDAQSAKLEPKSPRKCLLPLPTRRTKKIIDIFLCENCDAEFTTQRAIAAHERQCYDRIECEPPPSDPEDLLTYLNLGPQKVVLSTITNRESLNISLTKNRFVEFSSTLGQSILKVPSKRDVVSRPDKLVSLYDAYCNTSTNLRKPRELDFRRRRCTTAVIQSSHVYCFNRLERLERYKTLRYGLDKRSRMLLRQCRKCCVKVDRYVPPPPSPPLLITLECDSSSSEANSPVSPVNAAANLRSGPAKDTSGSGLELLMKSPVTTKTPCENPVTVVDLCSSDDE